jgi:hypothetical protein
MMCVWVSRLCWRTVPPQARRRAGLAGPARPAPARPAPRRASSRAAASPMTCAISSVSVVTGSDLHVPAAAGGLSLSAPDRPDGFVCGQRGRRRRAAESRSAPPRARAGRSVLATGPRYAGRSPRASSAGAGAGLGLVGEQRVPKPVLRPSGALVVDLGGGALEQLGGVAVAQPGAAGDRAHLQARRPRRRLAVVRNTGNPGYVRPVSRWAAVRRRPARSAPARSRRLADDPGALIGRVEGVEVEDLLGPAAVTYSSHQ